jgi:hypothetical protein
LSGDKKRSGRVAPAGGSGNVHVPVAVGGAALLVGLGLAGRDAASGLLDRSGKQAPARTRSAGKARPGPTTPATRRVRRTRAPREQQRERRERFRR